MSLAEGCILRRVISAKNAQERQALPWLGDWDCGKLVFAARNGLSCVIIWRDFARLAACLSSEKFRQIRRMKMASPMLWLTACPVPGQPERSVVQANRDRQSRGTDPRYLLDGRLQDGDC